MKPAITPVHLDLLRRLQRGGKLSCTRNERYAWITWQGKPQPVQVQSVKAMLRRGLIRRRNGPAAIELTLKGRLVRT